MYKALAGKLWVFGQLVLRGNIIITESLWKHTSTLAHEGYQGMTRTKPASDREKAWWPNMDKQVEQFVKTCHPCQLVGRKSKARPIRSTTLPDVPWGDIAVDLLLEIPSAGPKLSC